MGRFFKFLGYPKQNGIHTNWKKGIGVVLQMVSMIKNGRMLKIKFDETTVLVLKGRGVGIPPFLTPKP